MQRNMLIELNFERKAVVENEREREKESRGCTASVSHKSTSLLYLNSKYEFE